MIVEKLKEKLMIRKGKEDQQRKMIQYDVISKTTALLKTACKP